MMLIRGKARDLDLTWTLNLKSGSKVTSSMLAVFSRGSRKFRMSVRLCALRNEKSDIDFWSRNG